eukprot:6035417-Prymnesium_polylepis.1
MDASVSWNTSLTMHFEITPLKRLVPIIEDSMLDKASRFVQCIRRDGWMWPCMPRSTIENPLLQMRRTPSLLSMACITALSQPLVPGLVHRDNSDNRCTASLECIPRIDTRCA